MSYKISGYEQFKELAHVLYDGGLNCTEICSGLNLLPHTVNELIRRKLKGQGRGGGRKSKINKEQFIELWKKSIPYEAMANHFGVTVSTIQRYKYKQCPGITRTVLCNCGTVFETSNYARGVCDNCRFEHKIMYFKHKHWLQKIREGTEIIEKRHLREEKTEEWRKEKHERRKLERELEKPWWWD